MTILIVEDEEMVAELWRRFLGALSDDIRIAGTVPDALIQMRKMPPPDLVLLDLRMPGSTPENTLHHIAQLKESNPNAVVLVLTGASDASLPALAMKLGADGFQPKNTVASQDGLFTAIRDALRPKTEPQPGVPAYQRSLEMLERLTSLLTPGNIPAL